jgi:hypothetical protein
VGQMTANPRLRKLLRTLQVATRHDAAILLERNHPLYSFFGERADEVSPERRRPVVFL